MNQPQINVFRLGFQALVVFAFLRPILTTLAIKGGFPIHIILPSFFSYFLLVLLLFVIAQTKPKPDAIGSLIIIYCIYAAYSLTWESDYESLVRMTMPFIGFFSARIFLDNPKEVRLVLFALIAGYLIPIIGSSYLILTDSSIQKIDYYSEVERQIGLYKNIHTCAHAMGFFSVLFAFFLKNKRNISTIRRYVVYIIFVLSVYNMWNTYTRSVYIGFLIFWMLYLFQTNKRYFFVCFFGLLLFGLWNHSSITNIFLKTNEWTLDGASSGRLTLWVHNLKLFWEWPFYNQLLGSGLGTEAGSVIGGEFDLWSSHNDWISLLLTSGIIGFILYGTIVFTMGRDIFRSNLDKKTKAFFSSTLIMFIFISMITNGYIGRFERSTTFWLIMGCFYCLQAHKRNEKSNFTATI
jgi:hypothetical protein